MSLEATYNMVNRPVFCGDSTPETTAIIGGLMLSPNEGQCRNAKAPDTLVGHPGAGVGEKTRIFTGKMRPTRPSTS